MKYTSELIQEIVQSESGKEILDRSSPIYANAKIALMIFEALGIELDEIKQWGAEVAKQNVPQTATFALDYYEQNYKLPYDPNMSLQKRRERIISKMRDRAPMNPYRLANIASVSAANAEVSIEERTGKNKFTVWISSLPDAATDNKIKAEIDRAKPAHLIYDIKYVQKAVGNVYTGGIIRYTKSLTMRQVI